MAGGLTECTPPPEWSSGPISAFALEFVFFTLLRDPDGSMLADVLCIAWLQGIRQWRRSGRRRGDGRRRAERRWGGSRRNGQLDAMSITAPGVD